MIFACNKLSAESDQSVGHLPHAQIYMYMYMHTINEITARYRYYPNMPWPSKLHPTYIASD